jgi:ABC-type polysaccharide/polyol phosphate transport system ATPase subunit
MMPARSKIENIYTAELASSDETVMEVSNVTISYRSYNQRPTTLKESVLGFMRHGFVKYYSTFDALSDVSFSVPRGKVLGFVGSNGAGKSTLLKVLTQVLPPTKGELTIRGSVDSLIQLGAGFDPELNAVENIYLSGSLHGQSSAQIKKRVPSILEFAELEDFATTPIKYYSSGMYARLGFSVAIDREPDTLIVDEVLGVGDERFQEKCANFFMQFLKKNKTIIIVSHDLLMMESMADQIGVLSKGKLVYLGEPKVAIEKYRSQSYETRL